MEERLVDCARLGRRAPGLQEPPFGDALGKLIYERVSLEAWSAWRDDMMIKVINEYRLNLAEKSDYDILINQMKAFLKLDTEVEQLEVENAKRGSNS